MNTGIKAKAKTLIIGIKRKTFSVNSGKTGQASAAFETVRQQALKKDGYRCTQCGYQSALSRKTKGAPDTSNLKVHHSDYDHGNISLANLEAHCCFCFAYHHIGADASAQDDLAGWTKQMRIAYAPELSAQDLNLLQRAIGAAMAEPTTLAPAQEIANLLAVLSLPVRDVFGSNEAGAFAACLAEMSPKSYALRHDKLDGLRLIFHPDLMKFAGQELLQDHPLMPVRSWA
jgi:hypothetical protein